MVTLWAECHCGTLSLWQPFFAKDLGYFAKVLSFCMKMPGIIHPTWKLFMAVHLTGYGSVPILCSVFYLSLNPWEAPDWPVIATDADVKQVTTSWLQKLDNRALPWNISLGTIVGKCQDGSGEYIDVWYVPSASHVPRIDRGYNNILTSLLPYFVKVLCIYIAVWAGEFINTGCSEWWGFCVICW